MIDYLFLICTAFTNASFSLLGSAFNKKNEGKRDPQPLYNLLILCSVVVLWFVVWLFDFSFDIAVLPYSLIFGVGYAAATIGLVGALKRGPVALTTLIFGLSLIGTTIWGFFFWGDKPDFTVIIGLILVVISLFLCIYTKKGDNENGVSLKWLIYLCIAFFGNATAATTQRTQQMDFGGKHGSMLMFFATAIAFVIGLVSYLMSDRSDSKTIFKSSGLIPIAAGAINVGHNYLIILMASTALSPSLIYPVIGVGGLMIVTLFSVIVLKEKITRSQWFGLVIGAAATVLLSL